MLVLLGHRAAQVSDGPLQTCLALGRLSRVLRTRRSYFFKLSLQLFFRAVMSGVGCEFELLLPLEVHL
eukprot:NODE_29394_length_447_cov_2.109375.p2 GENE.NODE_29394_length_447_cov_2.109375~~NODE_29394_length_447_cov_2.109375.p2  ORF type:complete len:68 (+),score=12.17 NODE_29394_length_447_cov_2.109375:103-306(+)